MTDSKAFEFVLSSKVLVGSGLRDLVKVSFLFVPVHATCSI
jgi:hypothetical protein